MDDRRLPFYVPAVDPASLRYNESDSDGDHGPEREIDFTRHGNCLSSFSALSWMQVSEELDDPAFGLDEEAWTQVLHLPVFDVDVELTDAVQVAINGVFLGAFVSYVPSTNFHHAYVNGMYYCRDDYMERLSRLVDLRIVQYGYLHASKERHCTFVRKPHVRKKGFAS